MKYRVLRRVSWTPDKGKTWIDRDEGEDVSDAPAGTIKEWLAIGAIEEVQRG